MSASPESFPPGYLEEYNGNSAIACAITFAILDVIFVVLRFNARRLVKVKWGWDDTFVLCAAVFSFGLIACTFSDVYNGGVGYHVAAVAMNTPEKLIPWAKFTLIVPLIYLPAVVFPKLAVLALYLQIFSDRRYRWACWITGGFIVANCIANMIPAFVICQPFDYLWTHTPGGHCGDFNKWYQWSSLVNILSDIVMLLLPIPMLLKLQASGKVKAGLAVTFAAGSIGLVTALIRFVGFLQENMALDPTWTATRLLVLSVMEPGLYLIAACLLSFRPYVAFFQDKTGFSTIKWTNRSRSKTTANQSLGAREIQLSSRPNKGFEPL